MSSAELLKPILGGGIRSVNFFNGRLLSGEDMSREQEANREAHKMLGRAMGDGIAYGFEVSKTTGPDAAAKVTVQPGLAINRNGEALRLSSPINLSLVRPQSGSGTVADAGFSSCTPFQSGVYVSGSGVYLLTVCPARTTEGRAPVSGLQNSAADCNTKYLVDGVQFRLIQLDLTPAELNDQNHLRNLVAYRCFGLQEPASFARDPFGPTIKNYGLLDALRPNRLTDCDVPVGVLYWTVSDGIKFLDMWSVRRRLVDPATTDPWRTITGERRLAEAEAMLLQFEDQIEALRRSGASTNSVVATSNFNYLPPVGLIPIYSENAVTGFSYQKFFQDVAYRDPVFIEGAKLEPLFRNSLTCEPIDLTSGEMVWLYRVRENMQSIDRGGFSTPQPYMIFASGYVPFIGDAQFDLSRWDYSNYS